MSGHTIITHNNMFNGVTVFHSSVFWLVLDICLHANPTAEQEKQHQVNIELNWIARLLL